MNRKNIKLISIVVSIAILFLLILYADPKKFVSLIVSSDYRLILAALAISTFNIILRTLKWKVLLDKVSLRSLFPIQMLGMTISNFSPGKVAEPVKSLIIKVRFGLPVSLTLPSVVWERLLDVLVLLVLSLLGLSFFIPLTESLFIVSAVSFIAFIAVIIAILLFLYNRGFQVIVFRLLKKLPILNKISESFVETFEKSKVKKGRIVYSFFITSAAWLIEGFIIHYSLLSIGVSLSPLTLACVLALSTIIGIATALPGGIGSTDVVMALFLGALGIDQTLAITGVLISRFVSLWYVNLIGGFSLIYLAKKSKLDYGHLFG